RSGNRVIITVKGGVGSGKTGVCNVIRDALKAHYGPHIEVVAEELNSDINMLGEKGLHHPHPDHTQFVIKEELDRA
ncbi:hypothetical protein KXT90_24960, partial [Salmonella enterica subsp. enterica serovar Weltevreden]|nr:hypothetical protein [Salmonella enterica subsp. enterica serovar Weltevreden]MCH5988321.1 hypothetical protein [Salmonella enterica]